MSNRTLVLVALVAVSMFIVSLPASHSQTSANAPLKTKVTPSPEPTISLEYRNTETASRSAGRYKYATSNYNKLWAKSYMLSKYKWKEKQYQCIIKLWNRESGWRVNADNPNSSAYGIPQALPGKKMASAGPNWKKNPQTQIKWGLKYINSRYKTPCGAWSAFNKKGWY